MTSTRRDFLAALATGTGAVLMGKGWYRRGSGLIVPPAAGWVMIGTMENGTRRLLPSTMHTDREGKVTMQIPLYKLEGVKYVHTERMGVSGLVNRVPTAAIIELWQRPVFRTNQSYGGWDSDPRHR